MLYSSSLTTERLRQLVHYNPDSGEMVRLLEKAPFWGLLSKPAFRAGRKDYCKARIDGKYYTVSRLAFLFMTGKWPEHFADHIDGDMHNNKWANLRDATREMNAANNPRSRAQAKMARETDQPA